jgi:hypothetical protein
MLKTGMPFVFWITGVFSDFPSSPQDTASSGIIAMEAAATAFRME